MKSNQVSAIDFIQKSDFFKGLSQQDLEAISSLGSIRKYKANQTVFRPDKAGRNIYLVGDGELVLLLKNQVTVSYGAGDLFGEVAAFSKNPRLGTVRAISDTVLVAFELDILLSPDKISLQAQNFLLKSFIDRVIHYLLPLIERPTSKLIKDGESEHLEFKRSLNFRQLPPILKTIVAFMNSQGGTLLIGVEDDKNIHGTGIEEKDWDKTILDLMNKIKRQIGSVFSNLVEMSFEEFQGKNILRIDVGYSGRPAFFGVKEDEKFYIRSGPSNVYLEPSKAISYLRKRELDQLSQMEQPVSYLGGGKSD